ncbi:unnamed protein product [Ectocarpus fasciculatus]
MMGVQHEVDEEAKRVAASLREWREEQEQQIKAEASFAVSSLAEEKARAADREALFREMLLTERDKEDRLLAAWLLLQEREGCTTVNTQLLDAREQLTKDRERWVNDLVASMSETAGDDAAFFQSLQAWGRSGTSRGTIASGHTAPLLAGGLHRDLRQTTSANEEPGAGKGNTPARSDNSGLLSSTQGEVQACHQDSSPPADETEAALLTAEGGERDRSRLEFGAAVATTAVEAHSHGVSSEDNDNDGYHDRIPTPPATAAIEIETLAARKRSDHLESLAVLARQGMSAHWKAFFRDGVERTRMAAAAGDITAERWAQRQRQAIEVSRASWRSREWTSGSSTSDSGVDGGDGHVSGPEGRGAEGDGGGCGTGTQGSTNNEGERPTAKRLGDDAAQSPEESHEGGDGGNPCVIVVRDVGGSSSISGEAISSDSGISTPTAAEALAVPAATDKIVVFVGRAMAFHMSTVRECRMDHFHDTNRQRCSSVSLPPQQGQSGQRPSCTVSSIDIDALDPDGVLEQSREAGWLKALEHFAEHNTVLDMGEVGATFGVLPGGAAVLCLAHDCLVEGPGETEGFVRMDVLLSATSAFIALRRSIRATAAATKTRVIPRCEPNAAPVAGDDRGGGNTLDATPPVRDCGGHAVAVGSGEPLEMQTVPETAPPSPSQISGSETVTSNGTGMATTPTMMSTAVAAVAEMEVAVELDVYGDALAADLARVWLHPSSPPFLGDVGGTTSANGTGASPPRSQSHVSCSRFQTWRIRRAVEKHSAVLSPQSVCALTALLSAKGKEWADHSNIINQNFNNAGGVCGGRDDDRNGDHGGGPRGEDSSPAGDPTAWKLALSRALLVVRTASLEHLALWADACDPGKVESACAADVSRAVTTPETRGVSAPGMDSGDAEAPARAAVDGDEKAVDGGGGTDAAWAALHRASGLGLSPLMMLAATLFDDDGSTGAPQLFLGGRGGAAGKTSANCSGIAHGGDTSSNESGSVANLTTIMSRSVLRLLSRSSLDNVSRCLSRQNASREEEAASAASAASAATAGGEGGAEASTTQEGTATLESNSENRRKVEDSCGLETEENPEVLCDVPGHPAIGDLSKLDAETLRGGAEGIVAVLDARGTGWLPPAVIAVALQSGEAGFRLEPVQAAVVIRLSGCFPATSCPKKLGRSDQQQAATATVRNEQDLEKTTGGEYSYLGYPPRTQTVRYRPLVEQLPGLLRLVQAAHRLGKAATLPATFKASAMTLGGSRGMTADVLERNRQTRFRLSIERSGTALLTALEAACQRMAYSRLKQRSSLLEAPRLESMQQLADHARERTSSEINARQIENARRAEVRRALTSATKNKVEVASGTGALMVNMERARAAATGELFSALGLAMEQARRNLEMLLQYCSCPNIPPRQARQRLMDAVEQLNTVMMDAEEELTREESFMTEEDNKALEERDQEPEWWGESLTKEVEESYRQEAMTAQEVTENILKEANDMDQSMAATWEDDAQSCKARVAFSETGRRLENVMAEFEERRMASREAIGATNRDANRMSPSSSSLSSSTSSLQFQSEKKEQADFAESVQLRHRGINLCRENLAWLGDATHHLEAECVDLCERAARLPDRMEKRLSAVLNTAHAKGVEARSVVVRRLHAGSKSWGDELVQRKQRWRNLRASRRIGFEKTRARIESERERLGRLGPVASAARTVVLAQALHMAREPVNRFPQIAGKGPLAVEASEAVAVAAAALTQTHDAVRSIVAEASGGDATGTGVSPGGRESLRTHAQEDQGRVGGDVEGDSLNMDAGRHGVGSGVPGPAVQVSDNGGGGGQVQGNGGGGSGEVAAKRLLAMQEEDATARVSACQTAVREWWERQAKAVAEGMQHREKEAADRRTRREVEHLLSESLIADIEAREKAETHGRKTLALVTSEAKRIADQFVEALKSADKRINDAAADSKMAVEEEGEVLSLEAQSLSARVSATLQRGLNAATEDLAAAQQHRKNRKNKLLMSPSPPRGGEKASDTRTTNKEQFSEGEQEDGESVFGISSDESAGDLVPARNHHHHQQLARDDPSGSASGSASTSRKKSRLPFQGGFGAGG